MTATEQFFPVVVFTMLCGERSESVDASQL